MSVTGLIGAALMSAGLLFSLIAAVGVLRLPDFYTRLHAQGKCDSLGVTLFLAGIAVHEGLTLTAAKVLAVLVFVFITSPSATHALARAALHSGMQPELDGETK